MKVVAFLSRLKIMTEKELRVVFLQKRYQYLQSILADAAPHTSNPSSYMSKVTSVIKIHLFDILTQASAHPHPLPRPLPTLTLYLGFSPPSPYTSASPHPHPIPRPLPTLTLYLGFSPPSPYT